MFSPDLHGAQRRVAWCSFNARLVDMPPVLPIENILGVGVPDRVAAMFRGEPDQFGFFDHDEVQRCPLSMVDTASPYYDADWLGEVVDVARAINAELPDKWLPDDPTPLLLDGLIQIRSESDQAAAWRAEKSEEW